MIKIKYLISYIANIVVYFGLANCVALLEEFNWLSRLFSCDFDMW
jgi:hypothetical protein